jgi:hypothetical protein
VAPPKVTLLDLDVAVAVVEPAVPVAVQGPRSPAATPTGGRRLPGVRRIWSSPRRKSATRSGPEVALDRVLRVRIDVEVDEGIAAGAAGEQVPAGPAGEPVGAGVAVEAVVAIDALQHVVPAPRR